MATVLVFTIPSLGHVYPTLPIVAELVRRGDRVVYYCAAEVRAQIEATGAEFRLIPWDFSAVLAAPRLGYLALEELRCAEAWLPGLLKEVQEAAPDYLLVDFMCAWGRFAARVLGIPLALITSSFAIGPGVLPPPLLLTALDTGLSLRRAWMIPELRRIAGRLTRRYGVDQIRLPTDLLSMDGDLVLVTTSRLFQPGGGTFGERFHFVGPCIASRQGEPDPGLPALDARPLVYVSLGTVFNQNMAFFKQCVQAFGDGRYQVIMAVGPTANLAALGPLPAHIHAFQYIPQLAVLDLASLFISHGGMNSTSEALWHAVPLIAVPQAADQFAIASRIAALGVGRQLLPWQRRPARLRQTADALMDNQAVRERCSAVRRSFLEAGGARRAADILQTLGASRGPR